MNKTNNNNNALKLGLWLVFIVALIVYMMFSQNVTTNNNVLTPEEPKQEENVFVTYDEMQEQLLNSNYNYKFNIYLNEETYIYSGTLNEKINTGYKETKDGITKYLINESGVFSDILGTLEPLDDLYGEIDENYLNLETLFNNLKDYLYNVNKSETTRVITYNKDGYQVVVNTDLKNITNITITLENGEYNLEFIYI